MMPTLKGKEGSQGCSRYGGLLKTHEIVNRCIGRFLTELSTR